MRDPKPFSPIPFIFSIFFLSLGFALFSYFRLFPATETEWEFLANIKAITEEGGLISAREPLALWFVVLWKKLFGVNYIPAYLALAGIFYSLFLHLFMLLLRREEWKRNHYLIVYLASFLPYSYGFPTSYFSETLCLVFLLLLFLTFRFEKLTDLIVVPLLTFLAFISDFQMFYLGFTFFVIFTGIRSSRKAAQRTSVFYKKRNLPFLFLIGYLSFFIISLILFSTFDFFGPNSFAYLIKHWYESSLFILLPLVTLGIGHILLKTEKELNTYTASVVVVILIGISIYFIFRDVTNTNAEPWEERTKSLTKAYGMAYILKSDPIYLPKEFSYALYFQTGTKSKYLRDDGFTDKAYFLVPGVWSQDLALIQKTLYGRKSTRLTGLVPLGEDVALIQKIAMDKMQNVNSLEFIYKKMAEAYVDFPTRRPFDGYIQSLQKKFGYKSFF